MEKTENLTPKTQIKNSKKKLRSQTGAGLIEHSLIVGLIAVVAISSLESLAQSVGQKFCEAGLVMEMSSQADWSPGTGELSEQIVFDKTSLIGCELPISNY